LTPYDQNKYRILGASDVSDRWIAAFFTKNRLILFERAAAPDADYLIEQDNDRWRRGGGPKRHLTAVEFALPFTPRLVGNNARVQPTARGIVLPLRSALPQSAAQQ
jgi:hypothetical protein